MDQVKKCPKCEGEMVKGYVTGKFSAYHKTTLNFCVATDTYDYMCSDCGYIETYAKNPDVINK